MLLDYQRGRSVSAVRRTLFFCGYVVCLWASLLNEQSQAQDMLNVRAAPADETVPAASLYLPLIMQTAETPPAVTFAAIPIQGNPVDRPAATNPDLNLAVRSFVTTTGALALVDVNGPTDVNAPQLAGIFNPPRLPQFTAVYQVYDWNWNCGPNGCRGDPIANPTVTLLQMATTAGEAIHIPTRTPDIYAGGYKAMVLYAAPTRITLGYTREDTPARGYLVHIEEITVDPALLALYEAKNAAGRHELPALHNGEPFATASGANIKVAICDTGSFMDPRIRKNWWVGY